jgi:hypothetical protein
MPEDVDDDDEEAAPEEGEVSVLPGATASAQRAEEAGGRACKN